MSTKRAERFRKAVEDLGLKWDEKSPAALLFDLRSLLALDMSEDELLAAGGLGAALEDIKCPPEKLVSWINRKGGDNLPQYMQRLLDALVEEIEQKESEADGFEAEFLED